MLLFSFGNNKHLHCHEERVHILCHQVPTAAKDVDLLRDFRWHKKGVRPGGTSENREEH